MRELCGGNLKPRSLANSPSPPERGTLPVRSKFRQVLVEIIFLVGGGGIPWNATKILYFYVRLRDSLSCSGCMVKNSIYETKTNENKYLLNQEFHRMRFNESQSITSYCAQLVVIRQKLKTVGEELSDSGLVAKLINDLPRRFYHFRSNYYVQTASGVILTFDKVREQLIEANISSTAASTDAGDAW